MKIFLLDDDRLVYSKSFERQLGPINCVVCSDVCDPGRSHHVAGLPRRRRHARVGLLAEVSRTYVHLDLHLRTMPC